LEHVSCQSLLQVSSIVAPGWRGAAKELGWIDIEHSPQVLRLFASSFNLQVFAKSPEMGLFFFAWLLGCLLGSFSSYAGELALDRHQAHQSKPWIC